MTGRLISRHCLSEALAIAKEIYCGLFMQRLDWQQVRFTPLESNVARSYLFGAGDMMNRTLSQKLLPDDFDPLWKSPEWLTKLRDSDDKPPDLCDVKQIVCDLYKPAFKWLENGEGLKPREWESDAEAFVTLALLKEKSDSFKAQVEHPGKEEQLRLKKQISKRAEWLRKFHLDLKPDDINPRCKSSDLAKWIPAA